MSSGENKGERKLFRFQFSLTWALAAVTLVCVAMAWFHWTQRFKRATLALEKMQVTVSYDAASNNREKPQPHKVPKWKGRIFGEDFCFRINRIDIGPSSIKSSAEFWNDLAKHRSAMPEMEVVALYNVEINAHVVEVLNKFPVVEIYFHRCQFEVGVLERLKRFSQLRTVLFFKVDQELDYRKLAQSAQLTQIGFDACKVDLESCEFLRDELPEAYVFAM